MAVLPLRLIMALALVLTSRMVRTLAGGKADLADQAHQALGGNDRIAHGDAAFGAGVDGEVTEGAEGIHRDDLAGGKGIVGMLLMQAENLGVPLVFFLHFVVVHHLLAQLPQLLLGLFQLLPGFFGAAKLAEKAADPVRNAGHGGLERGDDGAGDGGWYGGQPPVDAP